MSSSEINVKFQGIIMKIGKMEYFCEKINSTQGQKRKTQTNLGGVYKGREGERRKEDSFRLCWGQKRFSRNQRIKVAFLYESFLDTLSTKVLKAKDSKETDHRIRRAIRLPRSASWISPTRRTGELDRTSRPTRPRRVWIERASWIECPGRWT